MTDQTKDAIERVRLAADILEPSDGQQFAKHTYVNDICLVLSELDRLTKPIEAGEVADMLAELRAEHREGKLTIAELEAIMAAPEPDVQIRPDGIVEIGRLYHRAADLIDRLARENERLQTEADHDRRAIADAETARDKANNSFSRACEEVTYMRNKAITTEARAERLAEALRAIPEMIEDSDDAGILSVVRTALNEPKAGTE